MTADLATEVCRLLLEPENLKQALALIKRDSPEVHSEPIVTGITHALLIKLAILAEQTEASEYKSGSSPGEDYYYLNPHTTRQYRDYLNTLYEATKFEPYCQSALEKAFKRLETLFEPTDQLAFYCLEIAKKTLFYQDLRYTALFSQSSPILQA